MLLLLLVNDEPTSPVLLPFRKNSFFSSASLRSWLGSLTIVPNFGATFFASATCPSISAKARQYEAAPRRDLIDDALRFAADVDGAAAARVGVLADVAGLAQYVIESGNFELGHISGVLVCGVTSHASHVTRHTSLDTRHLQRDDVCARERLRRQQVGEVSCFDVELFYGIP